MPVQPYRLEMIESAPFGQNSYVLWREWGEDGLVIDPGFDTRSILSLLRSNRLRVAAILNTHGHVDHIAGNSAIKEAFPGAPLVIGRNEKDFLTDAELNLSGPFGMPIISPPADRLVEDGERVEFAGFDFQVREVPGHSPGSVVFLCDRFEPSFVFGGDVLFHGSIGRTDFGGNYDQLMSGIDQKLLGLPDSTLVYSGHGPVTTIGRERRSNPFILDYARSRTPGRSHE